MNPFYKATSRNLICLFCALSLTLFLSAQPYVDLLNVKTQYFPSHPSGAEGADSLSMLQYDASFLLPLEQKNKDVLLFAGNYTSLAFDNESAPPNKTTLYSIFLGMGYEKQWKNPKWKTLIMVLPKINSDLEENTTSDFQLGGLVLATLKKSDSLKFHFGLYYNREFFGNYFMPILGIDWKINSHLNFFGDFPANLNLEYKISKKMYTGFAYLSVVNSFRLEGGNYVREGDKFWGYDQFKLFFNYHLGKYFVWFVEGGHTFGRIYQLYNSNHEELHTNPVFGENLDGVLINTGLALRFRLDEK